MSKTIQDDIYSAPYKMDDIKECINFEECPHCKAVAYLDHGRSKFCFHCYFNYVKWLTAPLKVQLEWRCEEEE